MKVTYSLLDKKNSKSVAEAAEEIQGAACFPYTFLSKQAVIQEMSLPPSCTCSAQTPDVLMESTIKVRNGLISIYSNFHLNRVVIAKILEPSSALNYFVS